jgi:hypothetical protein
MRASSGAAGCRAFELAGEAPVWGGAALALLGEAGALWRRASDASLLARDVLEGAAQHAGGGGLTLEEGGSDAAAGGGGGAPTAPVLYSALGGAQAVLADARRALGALAELAEALGSLRSKCEAAGARGGGAGEGEEEGEEEEEEGGEGAGGSGGPGGGGAALDSDALRAVQGAVQVIAQHVALQQQLVLGAAQALEAGGGGAGGEAAQ